MEQAQKQTNEKDSSSGLQQDQSETRLERNNATVKKFNEAKFYLVTQRISDHSSFRSGRRQRETKKKLFGNF